MLHELKSWVGLFEPIMLGKKTHDLRVMDRDFQVGDRLRLREWDAKASRYTGREVTVVVTYITSGKHQHCAFSTFALHDAMGILSIRLCEPVAITSYEDGIYFHVTHDRQFDMPPDCSNTPDVSCLTINYQQLAIPCST